MMREPDSAIVTVSAGCGISIGISEDNHLRCYSHDRAPNRSLGPATTQQIQSLIDALERLEIHAQ